MRKSVFDGSFYPSERSELAEFINKSMDGAPARGTINAVSYVAPHAGYLYSGNTAAFTYRAIKEKQNLEEIDTIVLVGPNHTGQGRPIAVSLEDWSTPLGRVANDRELSRAIAGSSECIDIDELAHRNEHSIEVQLPFLHEAAPEKMAVFVCMGDQSIDASNMLSKAVTESVDKLGRKALVVASSDLNHYESANVAKAKDSKLLDAARRLDHERFNKLVHELDDSVCGFGPITVAMLFARNAGAKRGIVLRYCTSGDVNGDYSSVVAYSSMAFV